MFEGVTGEEMIFFFWVPSLPCQDDSPARSGGGAATVSRAQEIVDALRGAGIPVELHSGSEPPAGLSTIVLVTDSAALCEEIVARGAHRGRIPAAIVLADATEAAAWEHERSAGPGSGASAEASDWTTAVGAPPAALGCAPDHARILCLAADDGRALWGSQLVLSRALASPSAAGPAAEPEIVASHFLRLTVAGEGRVPSRADGAPLPALWAARFLSTECAFVPSPPGCPFTFRPSLRCDADEMRVIFSDVDGAMSNLKFMAKAEEGGWTVEGILERFAAQERLRLGPSCLGDPADSAVDPDDANAGIDPRRRSAWTTRSLVLHVIDAANGGALVGPSGFTLLTEKGDSNFGIIVAVHAQRRRAAAWAHLVLLADARRRGLLKTGGRMLTARVNTPMRRLLHDVMGLEHVDRPEDLVEYFVTNENWDEYVGRRIREKTGLGH